jgi:hypothetical protein
MRSKLQFCLLVIGAVGAGAGLAGTMPDDGYLTPELKTGETYADVFSLLHSARADGYDEYVHRNGGSADYAVTSVDHAGWNFKGSSRLDGQPPDAIDAYRDEGRTVCVGGTCYRATEASGLIYNPILWGVPPHRLVTGMTWTVHIDGAWQLGGPDSAQTVTVVHVDPSTDTVTLMREGTSTGFFDSQSPQLSLTRQGQTSVVTIIPGRTHWKGYATFRKGVIISDELVATRQDMLRDQGGHESKASERWIMLLDAAPAPADPD